MGILIPLHAEQFVLFGVGSGFVVRILQIDALMAGYVEVKVLVFKLRATCALREVHIDSSPVA